MSPPQAPRAPRFAPLAPVRVRPVRELIIAVSHGNKGFGLAQLLRGVLSPPPAVHLLSAGRGEKRTG